MGPIIPVELAWGGLFCYKNRPGGGGAYFRGAPFSHDTGVTPCTASFSPLQQDLAFEFGVDIINHLQSPSTKFEPIALCYSGSREIDNGVTPPTLRGWQ